MKKCLYFSRAPNHTNPEMGLAFDPQFFLIVPLVFGVLFGVLPQQVFVPIARSAIGFRTKETGISNSQVDVHVFSQIFLLLVLCWGT